MGTRLNYKDPKFVLPKTKNRPARKQFKDKRNFLAQTLDIDGDEMKEQFEQMKLQYWEQEKKLEQFLSQLRKNPYISDTLMEKAENQSELSVTEYWEKHMPRFPVLEPLFQIERVNLFQDVEPKVKGKRPRKQPQETPKKE